MKYPFPMRVSWPQDKIVPLFGDLAAPEPLRLFLRDAEIRILVYSCSGLQGADGPQEHPFIPAFPAKRHRLFDESIP